MSAGWKQEYVGPNRSRGAKVKPKRERTHYSKNEVRLAAIIEEARVDYRRGIRRDQNPKVSEVSRRAWFQGWDQEDAN